MLLDTLTIVGVGLVGGSIGLAARRRGVVRRVLGVGRQPAVLEVAASLGAIDEPAPDLAAAVRQTDLAVFCTPVRLIAEQVLEAATCCRPGTVLTDAGSTKAQIVAAVAGRLPAGVHFVGGHPLAGSEKRGPEHATAELFQGRAVVLTPTPETDVRAVDLVSGFWEALGARARLMSPAEHDRALALTSHLPHLAASAVAGVVPRELLDLAATGFRDTTRIAAGDASLWPDIFRQNRAAVLDAVDRLLERLRLYRAALADDDLATLVTLWNEGKATRDALGS
jgi:prephenate dehydrogenase